MIDRHHAVCYLLQIDTEDLDMRKLASVRRIADILPIPDADAIEVAVVDGWKVVVKKNEYSVGDLAVYLEIDSWVPNELAPFLSKGQEPREYNGVKGERLRTVKLRGQISQGLLLKLTDLKFAVETKSIGPDSSAVLRIEKLDHEGADLTELLGIQKWEPEIPAQLAGQVAGLFPSWGRKTDQERCQNLWDEIEKHIEKQTKFEVTVKLDGTSASYGLSFDNEYVVCSRNLSLKTEQDCNTLVDTGRKYDLETKLKLYSKPVLISGELCGPGIQKNQESLKEHRLFVFDIYDPLTANYFSAQDRLSLTEELGLQHVPILYKSVTLAELGIKSLDDLLKFADGPSLNAAHREGIVFKSIDGKFSFKAISNKWLLKNE